MILPPAGVRHGIGVGDADRANFVYRWPYGIDFSEIDAERVVVDPMKLWIFVIEPIVFDQCRRFFITSKLQHDGVIDNCSKSCTGPRPGGRI